MNSEESLKYLKNGAAATFYKEPENESVKSKPLSMFMKLYYTFAFWRGQSKPIKSSDAPASSNAKNRSNATSKSNNSFQPRPPEWPDSLKPLKAQQIKEDIKAWDEAEIDYKKWETTKEGIAWKKECIKKHGPNVRVIKQAVLSDFYRNHQTDLSKQMGKMYSQASAAASAYLHNAIDQAGKQPQQDQQSGRSFKDKANDFFNPQAAAERDANNSVFEHIEQEQKALVEQEKIKDNRTKFLINDKASPLNDEEKNELNKTQQKLEGVRTEIDNFVDTLNGETDMTDLDDEKKETYHTLMEDITEAQLQRDALLCMGEGKHQAKQEELEEEREQQQEKNENLNQEATVEGAGAGEVEGCNNLSQIAAEAGIEPIKGVEYTGDVSARAIVSAQATHGAKTTTKPAPAL